MTEYTNEYGQLRQPPKWPDDTRITVIEPSDRYYGEHGFIRSWRYGMAGGVLYDVQLDVRDDLLAYHEDELQPGEDVFTR